MGRRENLGTNLWLSKKTGWTVLQLSKLWETGVVSVVILVEAVWNRTRITPGTNYSNRPVNPQNLDYVFFSMHIEFPALGTRRTASPVFPLLASAACFPSFICTSYVRVFLGVTPIYVISCASHRILVFQTRPLILWLFLFFSSFPVLGNTVIETHGTFLVLQT